MDGWTYTPTRREVLQGGALIVVGGMAGAGWTAAEALPVDPIGGGGPTFVTYLRRRNDLLDLRIEGWNVKLVVDDDGARLTRLALDFPAFLVVVFSPQATMEQAFSANAAQPAGPPIPSVSSGPSRLSFIIPPEGIAYTTEALLDWSQLEPLLVPVASGVADPGGPPGDDIGTGPPVPQIREPRPYETAIELPWRLFLSPHDGLGWAHAQGLVTHNGRTEIWHTRLGIRAGDNVDEWATTDRTIQAVWTPELAPQEPGPPPDDVIPPPYLTALTVNNRMEIVRSTSELELDGNAPANVNRLMLTPLGGYLDVEGRWQTDLGLEQWVHKASLGRDHYVRVVERGYLFPYGHRAAKITITERQFEAVGGETGGYLRKRSFIVLREPVKHYWPGLIGQPHDGRDWPFRTVRITTLVTPILDDDDDLPTVGPGVVPTVGGEPVLFHSVGTDGERRDVDFVSPVVFVNHGDIGSVGQVINAFDDLEIDLHGQTIAMAEPDLAQPGRTAHDIGYFMVHALGAADGVDPDELDEADEPPFYPSVRVFATRLSAADQVSGGGSGEQEFEFGDYAEHGFDDGNAGQVYGYILGALPNPEVNFPADRAGGLATPNLDVSALSRELGAVGGNAETIHDGIFDPEDFFTEGVAKLLGGIELTHVIQQRPIVPGDTSALHITTRPVHDDPDQPPIAIITDLEWDPELKADPLNLFEPDPDTGSMHLDATFRQSLEDPSDSTYEINGLLENFGLNLIGSGPAKFMIVNFTSLEFRAGSEQKTDLRPVIDSVEFAGPLQFVDRIKEYLTFGGSGPSIDFDAQGITAGYTLPLPQIPLGSVMLDNIAMSATLMIPWSGDPARIRFALSSRENPFVVTYSCIGGFGFFAIAFGLDGLEKFECSLALGAYVAMDIGVLSGSLSVEAGIYFSIEFIEVDGEELPNIGLTAYLRFVGKMQALGLIGVSLELYLGLGFELVPVNLPKLIGVARAEFKIKVLFFSGTVKVKVERRIGSTPNDPTFADLFDEPHWVEYANAFAPIGEG
jgi:hypothetical protein